MQIQIVERIKSRIEEHGKVDEIQQLCLDGIEIKKISQKISEEISKCTQVLYVTFNHCQIKSLENFPYLPEMMGLEIIDNQISGKDIHFLLNCHNIMNLALDQNNIRTIQDLRPLNNLQNLQHLEIRGNPICNINDYRAKIFEAIPKLKIVDSQDIFGDQDVMLQTQTDSQNTDRQIDNSSDQQSRDNQQQYSQPPTRKYRQL